MTRPVPAGPRPPGFVAPGTRPKIPSSTVGLDPANEQNFIAATLDSLVHKIQRVALFSGDIERNFKQILDHTKAAREVAQQEAQASTRQADGDQAGKGKKAKPERPGDVPASLRQASVAYERAPARTHDGSLTTHRPAPWQSQGRPVHTSEDRRSRGLDDLDPWHPGEDRPLIAGLPGDVDWDGREHSLSHMDFKGASDVTSNWSVLRQHTAQRLNQKLSERTPPAPYRVTANGRLQYAAGHPDAGKFVRREDLPGAKQEMAHYARGLNRMASIQGAINNVGKGEGLSGALGAVGTKLGWVGAAYGAAQLVGGQFADQREKNAYYQQIYGGSNLGAFQQRLGEEAFSRFRMFGTMGGAQARELYRGVSEIGLQGAGRSSALDFAVRNYRRTGLDTRTSVEVVRAAVQNGVTEFSDLGKQLDLVAKAAKQAGINVGEAQKAFTETYKMVSTNIVAGAAAGPVAGGLAAAQAALGEGPVSRLNLSQLAGDATSQRLQATALNMSPLTYTNQLAAGGTAAQNLQARGISAQLNQAASLALSPQAQARIQQIIAENGKPQDPSDFQDIAQQLQREGLLNAIQAQQVLTGYTRQNIDQASAGTIAVSAYLGAYQKDIQNTLGATGQGPDSNRRTRITSQRDKNRVMETQGHKRGNQAQVAYARHELSHGLETDSFVQRLVDAKDSSTSRVRVRRGDGTLRWVSLADAIHNEDYYNQIVSGNVKVKSNNKSEDQSLSDRFAAEDAERARSKATGKGGGKIEIYATPELRRLFGFRQYGGDQASTARSDGVPAPAFGTPTTATGIG